MLGTNATPYSTAAWGLSDESSALGQRSSSSITENTHSVALPTFNNVSRETISEYMTCIKKITNPQVQFKVALSYCPGFAELGYYAEAAELARGYLGENSAPQFQTFNDLASRYSKSHSLRETVDFIDSFPTSYVRVNSLCILCKKLINKGKADTAERLVLKKISEGIERDWIFVEFAKHLTNKYIEFKKQSTNEAVEPDKLLTNKEKISKAIYFINKLPIEKRNANLKEMLIVLAKFGNFEDAYSILNDEVGVDYFWDTKWSIEEYKPRHNYCFEESEDRPTSQDFLAGETSHKTSPEQQLPTEHIDESPKTPQEELKLNSNSATQPAGILPSEQTVQEIETP